VVSGRRLLLAAALLAAGGITAVSVLVATNGHPVPARSASLVVSYVVKSDGMPGWKEGVRRYLHDGVYIQPVAGGPARALLPVGLVSPVDPISDRLSPDGNRLAVLGRLVDARNHTPVGGFSIWVMNVDGSRGHTVATFPDSESVSIEDMTWTPDSRKIVFTVITTSADLEGEAFRLWQANADGPPDMAPMPGTSGLDMPAYDPATGALIAVKTITRDTERRRAGLVVLRPGSRNPVLLPVVLGATNPVFSPDGSRLAYLVQDDSGDVPLTVVDVANADGTEPVFVTTGGSIRNLAFGADGNLYYGESNEDEVSALYAVRARGGATPTKLRTIGPDASGPSVALVADAGRSTSKPLPSPSFIAHPPRLTATGALDLRTVDFGNIAAPGGSCLSASPIQLYDGLAYLPNREGNSGNPITFDPTERPYDQLVLSLDPVYGRLDAHGQETAAVGFLCDNNGGTADGQLLFSYAVYSGSSGRLRLIGLITPRQQLPAEHVTLLDGLAIHAGRITVEENWYGGDDGTCCPSGRAVSTWIYKDGRLVPQRTRIIAWPKHG
jgi:hypothetical protein